MIPQQPVEMWGQWELELMFIHKIRINNDVFTCPKQVMDAMDDDSLAGDQRYGLDHFYVINRH